jgi:hypothetical protein
MVSSFGRYSFGIETKEREVVVALLGKVGALRPDSSARYNLHVIDLM